MMSLCKLLGFPDRSCRCCPNIPPREDNGLLCVIEGSLPRSDRCDPGAWGLHEAATAGPTADLGLCTESLGSESCDTGVIADVANFEEETVPSRSPRKSRRSSSSEAAAKRKSKKFPQPLPWLSQSGGRRSCFMKGERKEGRFLLKEVRIERPEVLRASRHNGRLRLHLIESESDGGEDLKAVEEEEKKEGEEERVEVVRCQEEVNGGTMWWKNQPFVTTA